MDPFWNYADGFTNMYTSHMHIVMVIFAFQIVLNPGLFTVCQSNLYLQERITDNYKAVK